MACPAPHFFKSSSSISDTLSRPPFRLAFFRMSIPRELKEEGHERVGASDSRGSRRSGSSRGSRDSSGSRDKIGWRTSRGNMGSMRIRAVGIAEGDQGIVGVKGDAEKNEQRME